jgi:hypothetical protein
LLAANLGWQFIALCLALALFSVLLDNWIKRKQPWMDAAAGDQLFLRLPDGIYFEVANCRLKCGPRKIKRNGDCVGYSLRVYRWHIFIGIEIFAGLKGA